jgi:hypothetical protein
LFFTETEDRKVILEEEEREFSAKESDMSLSLNFLFTKQSKKTIFERIVEIGGWVDSRLGLWRSEQSEKF